MRDRASQQAALAGLGRQALSGTAFEILLKEAAAVAARELEANQVAVLERTRDGQGMLARAGYGLPDGVLGGVLPPDPSRLARDLSAASSIAAEVGPRFGVIEAHSGERDHFTLADAEFLEGVAAVLGAAGERAGHEDLVRDSEARFRELADTTPALMWMTDAEGDVTFVNEGWLCFTGRTLGEEMGDTFALSAHPEDRDDLLTRWRESFARRTEFRFEYRLQHHAGDYRWVLDVGIPRMSNREFV